MNDKITRHFSLLSLEIEGFQSIRDPVRIDFAPITLIYGPNSAGKSAVFDALELMKMVWDPINIVSSKVLQEKFELWTHIPSKKSLASDERSLTISVEVLVPVKLDYLGLGDDDGDYDEDEAFCVLGKKLKYTFKTTFNKYCHVFQIDMFSIHNLSENDEIISGLKKSLEDDYAVSINNHVQKEQFCFAGNNLFLFTQWGAKNALSDNNVFNWRMNFYGNLLVRILDQASPLVHADRSIPTPEDTICINNGDYISSNRLSSDNKISEHIAKKLGKKDAFFAKLSRLAVANKVNKAYLKEISHLNKVIFDADNQIKFEAKLIEHDLQFKRINRYLSDHLFIEKGYQIDATINFLAPFDVGFEFGGIDENFGIIGCSAIVSLFLLDTEARKLQFEDVGSGIAFVIPTLVSIAVQQISTIQQPELHLHPALQSSLGDVFINRLNDDSGNWQSIVETHSEHLLLRLLRKIRDTEKRKNTDFSVVPEDIAVYYFNPLPSADTTEVIKMSVTPLGDFYDVWPRGFFSDRDKDLFDE